MIVETIWQEFLKIIKDEAGSRVVDTWLKAVTLLKWDSLNKIIYIQAPNNFVKDWLKTHYNELFSLHLKRLLNVDNISIVFVDQSKDINNIEQSNSEILEEKKINVYVRNKMPTTKNNLIRRPSGYINSNYKFRTFVVGPNNSLAYSAAYAITQKPGQLYNPLFIYGQSGLGKTHLLHAIGNQIINEQKGAVVLYQTADRFVNEFINAIRFDKIHFFKEKYKGVDVLLIDDIQFISNKEQTQEAFFHIFNTLYEAHKQIVFTSDNYPKDIQGLAERLRSRLEWGLITDIHAPTLETKIAILKKKLEMSNENINEDVLYFIASRAESNVRELEGSLIRVLAFANLTNQIITLDMAKKVLGDIPIRKNIMETKINFSDIAKVLSKKYSYSLTDLQSKDKNKDLSFVRQIAMYLMKQMTDKSLQEIAFFLKRKNHSTIIHAIDKIKELREKDFSLNSNLKQLEKEILNRN
jgi:chromosomal replication initiator protein